MAVELTHDEDADRVTVTVDGAPITAYRWEDRQVLQKPTCFPVYAPDGRAVTRGYPIESEAGERVDHPHHIGFWLNYGNVNGYDFWNNSGDGGEDMGHIDHRGIREVTSGEPGTLRVDAAWLDPDERQHLTEATTFRFHANDDRFAIDRVTELTADRAVDLDDDKEGLCAIRVHRALEQPEDGEIEVVGGPETGSTTTQPGGAGRTGEYLTSDGARGADAWGTRAEWVRLGGSIDDEPVAVTLMDHPDNVGHPTFWHARGYGLFSANPLGQAAFTDGETHLGYGLEEGESLEFRFRLRIDAAVPDEPELAAAYDDFADDVRSVDP